LDISCFASMLPSSLRIHNLRAPTNGYC